MKAKEIINLRIVRKCFYCSMEIVYFLSLLQIENILFFKKIILFLSCKKLEV